MISSPTYQLIFRLVTREFTPTKSNSLWRTPRLRRTNLFSEGKKPSILIFTSQWRAVTTVLISRKRGTHVTAFLGPTVTNPWRQTVTPVITRRQTFSILPLTLPRPQKTGELIPPRSTPPWEILITGQWSTLRSGTTQVRVRRATANATIPCPFKVTLIGRPGPLTVMKPRFVNRRLFIKTRWNYFSIWFIPASGIPYSAP